MSNIDTIVTVGVCAKDDLGLDKATLGTPADLKTHGSGDSSSIGGGESNAAKTEEGQCTWVGGTMNLFKACVGTGILALPSAFGQAGWAVGVITLCFAAVTTCVAMMLLTRCTAWMNTKPTSYGKLCAMTFPRIAFLVDICILLACFGACLSYLIIMGGLLPKVMVAFGAAPNSLLSNRTMWLSIFFFAIDVPLTCLRNIEKLSYSSGLALLSIVYVVVLCILFLAAPAPSLEPCPGTTCKGKIEAVSTAEGFLRALPTFIFSYIAHFIIFNIYDTLRAPSVRKMEAGVVAPSMTIVTILYGVFGLCGYFTFGASVSSNILGDYPSTTPVTIAQFIMSFVVAVTYPLCMHATRDALTNLVKYAMEGSGKAEVLKESRTQNIIYWSCTVGLLALSYVIAIFVDNLGMVIGLVGTICGVPIGYILPGLFYCKIFGKMRAQWDPKHEQTLEDRVLYFSGIFLVVFGVLFLPVALVFLFI